jgi:putative glutamine amidotransferase
MGARPVVGITANVDRVAFGAWHQASSFVPQGYVAAVQAAGGLALVLPPDPAADEDAGEWLDLLDGLLLSGGADIDPAAYGQEPHPETVGTVPARDRFELALTRGALERELPVLGICRGLQLLNVARGGTLHQHLPDVVGHSEHRRVVGTFEGNRHAVDLDPGSLAARAVGDEDRVTASHHHQGVDRVGEGLVVTGRDAEG